MRVAARALTGHPTLAIRSGTEQQSGSNATFAAGIASFILAATSFPLLSQSDPASNPRVARGNNAAINNSNFLSKDFIVDAVSLAAPSVVHISSTTTVGLGLGIMGSAGSGFIISKVRPFDAFSLLCLYMRGIFRFKKLFVGQI